MGKWKSISLFSDGHLNSEVRFRWKDKLPVEKDENIELPEHVLADAKPGNCTKTYDSTGVFSVLLSFPIIEPYYSNAASVLL